MGQGKGTSGRRMTSFEWEIYRKTFNKNFKRRRSRRYKTNRSSSKRDN